MPYLIILRLRRAAILPVLALGVLVAACSGGGDVTGPTPEPPHQPAPPTIPAPPTPEIPSPVTPIVAGTYALVLINQSEPGQLVTIANPDGQVIGLYRFQATTRLVLSPMQSWSLELQYSDDKTNFVLSDEGEFGWSGDASGVVLNFESAIYGDVFAGKAKDGVAAIRYDLDGDGRLETTFGFHKIGD
jgi:hypothetical protein